MADLSYICNVCNKAKFSLDNLEEAEKHSETLITEGDYHGFILKEEYKRGLGDVACNLLLLIKSKEVTEDHERIYNRIEAIGVTPELLNHKYKKASKSSSAKKVEEIIWLSPPMEFNVNEIDKQIKDKKWVGLDEDEFSKFTEILDVQNPRRSYCYVKLEKFKTL